MPICTKLRAPGAVVGALVIGLLALAARADTYSVTQIGDSGGGSLRQAIIDANTHAGADTIQFNLGTLVNPVFVNLQTPLPAITGDVTIIGPGAAFVIVEPDPITNPPPFTLFSITGTPTVEIRGLSMTNGGGTDGAGVSAVAGTLTVRECALFQNNATNSGGAIAMVGAGNCTLNITDTTMFANNAVNLGGAVAVVRTSGVATVNLSGATLARNTTTGSGAGHMGGGLYLAGGNGPHVLNITASTINDNAIASGGSGGGVFVDALGGPVMLTNATISGNSSGMGSAITFTHAVLTIRSCTFTANNAMSGPSESSIFDVNSAGMSVKNTILSGNIASGAFRDLAPAQIATGNNNLVGIGGPFVNGVNGNIVGITNPRLVPMNINGGTNSGILLQPQTFALQPDSAALDAGSNADSPPTDERGQMRPSDGDNNGVAIADIGAFETQRYLVTTDLNSGMGSLREAIIDNNAAGGGFVKFAIPALGQQQTITPKSPLPAIVRTIVIDAWSQGGQAYQGPPLVEIDGFRVPDTIGLDIQASDCIVRGLSINNFSGVNGNGVGIKISTARGIRNWVYGCYVGVRPDGVTPRGNGQLGIWIAPTANSNIIGTNADNVIDSMERNVISGSTHDGLRTGVYVESNSNIIAGNNIGTDVTGMVAIPNSNGIWVRSGSSNQIGTSPFSQNQLAERNIIAGNLNVGVSFTSQGSNNFVSGNYIGLRSDGGAALPNMIGALLDNVNRTLIGGTSPGERNIISGNQQQGVIISGVNAFSNLLQGNYIGTNTSGMGAVPNGFGGVVLRGGVTFTRIGAFGDNSGVETGRRNVISGNGGPGVVIQDLATNDNRVMGDYIGVGADGHTPVGNVNSGVLIFGSPNNLVGALGSGRNVIGSQTSPVSGDGVTISGADSTGNKVSNNFIGIGADGSARGNASAGVTILNGASRNTIGGTQVGEGNMIANNGAVGVRVLGDSSIEDSILGNSIVDNARLGIDLKDDGVTPNGPALVVRVGPNALQNYPMLLSVTPGGTITATLAAKALTFYRVEYFTSAAADPSMFGEGRTFLGFRNVLTDATGNVGPFASTFAFPAGESIISSTATELLPAPGLGFPTEPGAPLGTSEFSMIRFVNSAPTTTDEFAATLEDTDVAITLTAMDPDPNPVFVFRITGLPSTGQLLQFGTLTPITTAGTAVDDAQGRVIFRPLANQFGSPYASFNFLANDGMSDSNESVVTISVAPIADTPSVTDSSTIENVQTTSGLEISRNPVDGPEVTHFKITAITSGTLFQNDGVTPVVNGQFITAAQGNAGLRFTPALNFNGTGTFNVQASLSNTDAGIGGGTATAHILVTPVGNQPAVTDTTTPEDMQSTTGLVITRNSADGPEVTHFKVFGITNGTLFQNNGTTPIADGSFITVAQGNAGLKYTPNPNFFGTGNFQVRSSLSNADSGVGGPAATATIIVTPVADTPSVTDSTTIENVQTSTGLIITRNPVDGPEVTHFKITAITSGTLFQNDGVSPIINGQFITVAQGNAGLRFTPALDFNGTATFNVQASLSNADSGIGGGTATAHIVVTPVGNQPAVTDTTTPEDTQSTTGLVVTRNSADGPEITHFKVFGITNGTLFQNNGTTPIAEGSFITVAQGNAGLKYTPNPNFFGTGNFQVRSSMSNSDAGVGGPAATATITVTPVADTPSVTNSATPEDVQTTTGLVISRNPVDGPEVTHFKITAITSGTLFQNDGVTPIIDGQFITFAQGNAGLRFTPAPNFVGNGSFNVQASLSSADADIGGGTATAIIVVSPVPDAPGVTNATTLEDTQSTSGLVITRNAADGSDVMFFKITGLTTGQLFQNDGVTPVTNGQFITVAQGNAGLRYTPPPDFNGPAPFNVQASTSNTDSGLGGAVIPATITVIPVNDRPNFTAANPPPTLEDAGSATVTGWVTNFTPGPANESDQHVLSYTLSGVTNPLLFSVPPTLDNAGTLRYTPAADANGTSQFTVVVRDDGGTDNGGIDTSLPQTFTITVLPVNDQPAFTAAPPPAVLEASGAHSVPGFIASFTPGPANESGQQIAAVLVDQISNPGLFAVLPNISLSGQLTYTTSSSGFGTSTFRVRVRDNGGTANGGVDTSDPQTFTIILRPMAVCQDVTIDARTACVSLTVQPGAINLTPADAGPGATQTITFSRPLTVDFAIGITPVTVTATYSDGLVSTCIARVTVLATDCNANGIPDSCETMFGGLTDCNGDAIPDNCQCLWDDGMVFPTDAPNANGQLSHYGNQVAMKSADDFYLCPNRMYKLFEFKGQLITNTLIHKAQLEFYEDCDGHPAETPFKTFTNSVEDSSVPAMTGFSMVTYSFDLCSENFYLEGGKSYWVSLVGRTDFVNPNDASYWVSTTPLANPTGVMGMAPVKRQGIGGPPPYPVTFQPWQPAAPCCNGCVNLAWKITGEECLVAWDNGTIDLNTTGSPPPATAGGSPSDYNTSLPYLPRTADNFMVSGCDPVQVCYAETYIWTNCDPVQGFAEIYDNDCSVPGLVPVFKSVASRADPIPGATITYNGSTLRAYKLVFYMPGWTLGGGKNYWISSGTISGGNASGRGLFAYSKPNCANSSCAQTRLSPGRFLDRSTSPAIWTDTGHDFAFKIAVRGTMGLVNAQPSQAPVVCAPDINHDHLVNVQDLFDYLSAWFSGCP